MLWDSSLPADVAILIFSLLRAQDIARCIGVCHYFYEIITSNLSLQYQIELARTGMVDGDSNTLPLAERLQRLRCYSSKFRAGDFDHTDLSAHLDYALQMRQLRTNTVVRGRVVKKWAIDDAQDLLVTVEWSDVPNSDPTLSKREEVFFYSLSGSKTAWTPHSAATVPSLVAFSPDGVGPTASIPIFKLCIARENVVIERAPYAGLINYHSLDVWNWMTGQFIKRIEVQASSMVNLVPFDGIYVIVLARYSTLCINVYSLAPAAPNHAICALEVPQDVTSKLPFSCQIASGQRPASSGGHFRPDPSLSMVSITLHTEDIQYEYASIFLIPHATLLAHIQEAESRQLLQGDDTTQPGSAVVPVPWADWGPCACLRLRLHQLPHRGSDVSLFPSGSRAPVVPFRVSKIWEKIDSFFVFDVNPLAARHAKQLLRERALHDPDQTQSEHECTAIVEDVEAALPGVVDPACSAIPYVVYRFKIPACSTHLDSAGRTIRAVEMSMTGFTVQFSRVSFEESLQTWTV